LPHSKHKEATDDIKLPNEENRNIVYIYISFVPTQEELTNNNLSSISKRVY